MKTKAKNNRTELEERYTHRMAIIQDLLKKLQEKVENMPAPDDESVNWGHVGDMGLIIAGLQDLVGDKA